jgi:RNA polymerase sigma-70 factor (ECF subfamily)
MDEEVLRLRDGGDLLGASTLLIEALGPELLGFLRALTRDDAAAGDVFADLCVRMWRSLPAFRGDSALRTWAYVLARRAFLDHREARDAWQRRHVALATDAGLDAVIGRVGTSTTVRLREQRATRAERLRARLDPEDQALLTLRIDRGLAWDDVARVLAPDEEDRTRASAALRKRFERLKATLRRMAETEPA